MTSRSGPLVMLLHKDAPPSRIPAVALGASLILCAPFDIPRLRAALVAPGLVADPEPLPACAIQVARQARDFFATVFVPDQALTQTVVDNGTDFIGQAIHDTGIRDWVPAVRRFDDVTHQHCLLVAGLAAAFARSLGLGEAECHRLTKAAFLHDVGKIHVPTAILNKPGKLDAHEMAIMKRNLARGHAMLAAQEFHPEVLQVVRSHHEMLDGSGYSKAPMAAEKAFAILESMTGRLDATIVEAFRPVTAAFISRFPLDGGAEP